MADSPFWMIWPGNAALSVLAWFVVAIPFLYAARAPVHALLRALGQLAGGPLRLGSRALLAAANDLRERNRAVLGGRVGMLRGAVQYLTSEQRQVLSLRFEMNLPSREVAHRLGKNEGAIRALQFRALGRLRKILSEQI